MAPPRVPNPPGGQKQISPVMRLVRETNPDDLALWREQRGVSEEAYEGLLNKRRPQVNEDMKAGPKGFKLASQTLIASLGSDPDSELTPEDITALKSDVLDKTAKATAEAEKNKAEEKKAAEDRSKGEDKKKEAEWTIKNPNPTVHSIAEYTASMLGSQGKKVAQVFAEFEANLSDTEAATFEQKLAAGIPKRQLATLVRSTDLANRKLQAKAMGLI